MIVGKTNLKKIPASCNQCKFSAVSFGRFASDSTRSCSLTRRACPMEQSPNKNWRYVRPDWCPLVHLEELAPEKKAELRNQYVRLFIELVQAHPNLPVIPMVEGEIVADDTFRRWTGSFGLSVVDRYYVGQDAVYFYDEKDMQECLNDPSVIWEDEMLDDEKALEVYRALPWTEAIILNIDLPAATDM